MFNTPAKYLESYAGQGLIMVHREDLEEWAKLSAVQPKPYAEIKAEATFLISPFPAEPESMKPKWEPPKCLDCNSTLHHTADKGVFICPHCGQDWFMPSSGDLTRVGEDAPPAAPPELRKQLDAKESELKEIVVALLPCQYTGPLSEQVSRLRKERDAAVQRLAGEAHMYYRQLQSAEARVKELAEIGAAEVAEFNAGFEHAQKGGKYEDEYQFETPHDQWGCGFAWGAFETLRSQVKELEGERLQLQRAIHGEDEWSYLTTPGCVVAMPTTKDSYINATDTSARLKTYMTMAREKIDKIQSLAAQFERLEGELANEKIDRPEWRKELEIAEADAKYCATMESDPQHEAVSAEREAADEAEAAALDACAGAAVSQEVAESESKREIVALRELASVCRIKRAVIFVPEVLAALARVEGSK